MMTCFAAPVQAGRWTVYYGSEAEAPVFDGYDLVVFDADNHPPLEGIQNRGATVLGYISIGEIEEYRQHYDWARRNNLILRENENWPGNYMIDIRRDVWLSYLVNELVPRLIRDGFDGIMLDTVDSPLWLQRQDPERFGGMTDAAVRIIRALDANFPGIEIMLNRAYDILPQVGPQIDYVLGESVYTDYDFKTETYGRVEDDLYQWQVNALQNAKERNAGLRVVTLDYWDPDDKATIQEIYQTQRANGFWPYVATIDLQKVIPEPAP